MFGPSIGEPKKRLIQLETLNRWSISTSKNPIIREASLLPDMVHSIRYQETTGSSGCCKGQRIRQHTACCTENSFPASWTQLMCAIDKMQYSTLLENLAISQTTASNSKKDKARRYIGASACRFSSYHCSFLVTGWTS